MKFLSLILILILSFGAVFASPYINEDLIAFNAQKIPVIGNVIKKRQPEKHEPVSKRRNRYIYFNHVLNLSEEERDGIKRVYELEMEDVKPYALELEAKYLREDELNAKKCRIYQRKCKKELKKQKVELKDEIKEAQRQILVKKEYYKALYLNELTRNNCSKLRQLIFNKTKGHMELW